MNAVKLIKRTLLKTLLILFVIGFILATVSLLCENAELHDLLTICLYAEFTVLAKSTTYGFPLAFLTRSDWVRMIGCGPILGRYSTHFFCPFKFTLDATFYALVVSPLFLLIRHRVRKREKSPSPDRQDARG
jgi:hypothetical protein